MLFLKRPENLKERVTAEDRTVTDLKAIDQEIAEIEEIVMKKRELCLFRGESSLKSRSPHQR